ncbi:MAG: helix-hairpin-helix domain-containing protein [Phycisphaerae bacterium]|nr:helix-hairpin-helix domain-containing protein [Phycisphaerae bacterium]
MHTYLDVGLSKPNLCAVIAIVGAAWIGIAAVGLSDRCWFEKYPNADAAKVRAAREFIDPNTAAAAALQRLSGIGPTRAEAIIAYRQQHGVGAFDVPADLEKIHGIGPKTVKKNREYLIFPSERKESPRQ